MNQVFDDLRKLYDLGASVGAGATGTVFRAVQRSTGRLVAIKLLSDPLDAPSRERFLREGQLLASIRHPAIMQVLDTGEAAGVPYVVSEYLGGGSLRSALRAGPWRPADAVALILECLSGLEECHRQGILHRDVKPENILLTERCEPKLADFGLALDSAAAIRLTATGAFVGTPLYMAPELFDGGQASVASDLYAVAVTLHELLSGQVPFIGHGLAELIVAHRSGRERALATPCPGAPAGMDLVLARGLARDPSRRPQSARAFRLVLERFGPDAPVRAASRVKAPAPTPAPYPGPTAAHGTWFAVVMVALGLLATACLIASLRSVASPDGASAAAREAALDPPPPEVQRPYHAAMGRGDHRAATDYLRVALKHRGDNAWLHLQLSVCLSLTGQQGEALREADQASRLAPRSPEALVQLATLHLGSAHPEEARGVFQRAVGLDPRSAVARHGEAYCLEVLGRLPDALVRYRAILADHPAHADTALRLADLDNNAGDPVRAERELRNVAACRPLPVAAKHQLIRSLILQRKSREALQEAERLAPAEALSRDREQQLAVLLEESGQVALSADRWKRIPETPGEDTVTLISRGRVLLRTGALDAAARNFGRALELLADDPGALIWMAQVEHLRRRDAVAAQHIRRAVALVPASGTLFALQARIALELGDVALAEQRARGALRLDPQLADAGWTLAVVLARIGSDEECLKTVARTRSFDPAPEYGLLAVAREFSSRNDFADAELLCREAYQNLPFRPDVARDYQDVLLRLGKKEKATEVLNRLLARPESRSKALEGLGAAYLHDALPRVTRGR